MTKLLIVDDEQIERDGMQAILRKAFPELHIEQAKNGKLALEMAATLQPDLILMDIKMPGINGLEAIELISRDYPHIKFVMVTAYDTFDYARTAIKLGVKDYLLKPSKASEIAATVSKVLAEIAEERRLAETSSRQQDVLKKILPVVEADLVTQLLFDHVHEVHIDESLGLLGMSADSELFALTVLLPQGSASLHSKIREKARQVSEGWVGALNGRYIPVIVFRDAERSYRSQAISIARELLSIIETTQAANAQAITAAQNRTAEQSVAAPQHGVPQSSGGQGTNGSYGVQGKAWSHDKAYFIGIGGVCQSLHQIRQSYQEALIASLDPGLAVKYQFYADSTVLGMARERVSANQWERQFFDRIRQGQWEQIEADMLELLRWCERDSIELHIGQQRVLELLWLVTRVLIEMGLEVEMPLFSYQLADYNQLRLESTLLLNKLQQASKAYQERIKPDAIQQMKQYIYEHSHEDISLETLASQIGLSPVYISKLFKEQLGVNYIDFLTQCRIEKAKKLMADPARSMKEITFEVGYHDPNYFSKVFKKMCDVSPTEYRRALFGKGGAE